MIFVENRIHELLWLALSLYELVEADGDGLTYFFGLWWKVDEWFSIDCRLLSTSQHNASQESLQFRHGTFQGSLACLSFCEDAKSRMKLGRLVVRANPEKSNERVELMDTAIIMVSELKGK